MFDHNGVVLLNSGGLDSMLMGARLKLNGMKVYSLHVPIPFDEAKRKAESLTSKLYADFMGWDHLEYEFNWPFHEQLPNMSGLPGNARALPFRRVMLLTIGGMYAYAKRVKHVAGGWYPAELDVAQKYAMENIMVAASKALVYSTY
jgi:7-cyano-7-deazaguanine synthase in queuosine biosynthesis